MIITEKYLMSVYKKNKIYVGHGKSIKFCLKNWGLIGKRNHLNELHFDVWQYILSFLLERIKFYWSLNFISKF